MFPALRLQSLRTLWREQCHSRQVGAIGDDAAEASHGNSSDTAWNARSGRRGEEKFVVFAAVQRLRLAGNEDGWWLAEQLRAMALRHGLDSPTDLALYGRHVPGLVAPPEAGLAVAWPERDAGVRPKQEPLIDLPRIGGARA